MRAARILRKDLPAYRKSKKCRICNAGGTIPIDITTDMLDGMGAPAIVQKYADRIKICTTNVYSHKKHCDSRAVALRLYNRAVAQKEAGMPVTDQKIKALTDFQVDRDVELLALIDACVREYIADIARCNKMLAEVEAEGATAAAALPAGAPSEAWKTRRALLRILEHKDTALGQLSGHAIQHFRTIKGVPDRQINIQVLQMNIGGLVDDLATMLARAIPDNLSNVAGGDLRRKVGTAFVEAVEARFREVLPIETSTEPTDKE